MADAATSKPPTSDGVTRVQVEEPSIRISEYVMWGSLGIVATLAQLMLVLFLAFSFWPRAISTAASS